MATATLRDTTYGGSTSIALSVMQEGNDFGGLPNDGGPQVLSLRVNVTGTSADDREQDVRAIRRMLRDASDFARQGLDKRVEFVVQGDNVSVASVWDVLGGELLLEGQPFGFIANNRLKYVGLPLRLDVMPSSRSTESTVVNAQTLRLGNGITHRWTYHTGATIFSDNMAGMIDGQLFQKALYGLAPANAVPQANDAIYFGNVNAVFSELAFGIRTVGSGITWSVWQYWNGSAWTTLTTLTNPFASGGNLFGVATGWSQMTWTPPGNWATTTINGVVAFWVRAFVSSVSSPVSPVISGPVCTAEGRGVIAANAVGGDLPARPKVTLRNPSATAMAAVQAAVQTGRLTSAPGPWIVPLHAADVFTPSGDITAAKVTDTGAIYGEAVEFTMAASLSDRGQTFDGSTQSATKAIGSGDKVDTMGTAGFFIEMAVKFDVVPSGPVPLISRWNTSANSVFWCGVDSGGRLKMMVYNSGGGLKIVRGTTPVEAGVWQTIGYEWAPLARKIRVYLETGMQAEQGVGKAALRTAVTTALNLAHSVGFTSATDADDGADSEGFFDGTISYVWGEARTVDAIFGVGHYPGADTKRTTEGYANVAGTTTRVYYELDDNAATTVLLDTATGAGAALNFARTGNSSANTTVGYFQGGVGVEALALSTRIPLPFGREYAGRFLPILRARPTATLTSVNDIKLSVQFGPGDIDLPLHDSGLVFPDVGVPAASGYYMLPCEPVTLPPADLGHYRSGEGARSYLQVDIFIQHAFITSTTMRVGGLILLPIGDFSVDHQSFRDEYLSAQALAQNESLIVDGTGLYTVVEQTGVDGATPERNSYALATRGGVGIKPAYPAWLVGFAQRGSTVGTDHLESVNTDVITGSLVVQPRHEGVAV